MVEFLILRQNYWTGKEAEAIGKMGDAKFNAGIHRPWDITSVHDDGFYYSTDHPKGHGWNREIVYMIQATETTVQFIKHYKEPLLDVASLEETKPIIKRHRWHFPNLPLAIRTELEDKRTIKIAWSALLPYLVEKTS